MSLRKRYPFLMLGCLLRLWKRGFTVSSAATRRNVNFGRSSL